ncbi:hypothetical protein M407DRAFT_23497 [Tulasnella calospora MUT 4182]|uniref:Uncharacterized protein n=1 Tax=Tulasnella calospora MUT 4182 TaxID=1051891 RepID=A0A0C3M102_9AGAM|nr:hypothetical protein M407DRAFT_23497 [Tulasnella calospora MUT 4182]
MSHRGLYEGAFRRMLQLIAQYLPNIVDLAVRLGSMISAEILLDEIPKITSISHLALLEFGFEYPNSPAFAPSTEFSRFAVDGNWNRLSERLKELCPSLTDIEYTPLIMFICGNAALNYRFSRRDYL